MGEAASELEPGTAAASTASEPASDSTDGEIWCIVPVDTCDDCRRMSRPRSIPPVVDPKEDVDCEGSGSPRLSTYNENMLDDLVPK